MTVKPIFILRCNWQKQGEYNLMKLKPKVNSSRKKRDLENKVCKSVNIKNEYI